MDFDELNVHVWRGKEARSRRPTLATGHAPLDDYLPGRGWPVGALTEIFVERYGIGELTLLMPPLAALTRADGQRPRKWVVWIAPPFVPYAPALARHGVEVGAVLLVQPKAGKDRLWTVEQVIRSGSSSAVLAWLAAADHVALRRLQLAAEEQGCWVVLFRPAAARRERSPAALRLCLERTAAGVRVAIDKCRGARPGCVDLGASFGAESRHGLGAAAGAVGAAHAAVADDAASAPGLAGGLSAAVGETG